MRKKAIRQVESTSWLSRQTKSKVMQKLATTKVQIIFVRTQEQRTKYYLVYATS